MSFDRRITLASNNQYGDAEQHVDVVVHNLAILHPLRGIVESIVQGSRESSERLLTLDIGVEELHVVVLLGSTLEFDPHLDPDAFGSEKHLEATFLYRFPATRIAVPAEAIGRGYRERQEQLFGPFVWIVVQVVNLRHRRPFVQNAHDPVRLTVQGQHPADGVGTAEQFLVGIA
jgi:hypothetical protein